MRVHDCILPVCSARPNTYQKLPIWLGTGTDANVKLTAEVADGWLPPRFVPGSMETYRPWLEEGFRRAGNGKLLKDFEIQASTSVTITDDVCAAFRTLRTWERGVA